MRRCSVSPRVEFSPRGAAAHFPLKPQMKQTQREPNLRDRMELQKKINTVNPLLQIHTVKGKLIFNTYHLRLELIKP